MTGNEATKPTADAEPQTDPVADHAPPSTDPSREARRAPDGSTAAAAPPADPTDEVAPGTAVRAELTERVAVIPATAGPRRIWTRYGPPEPGPSDTSPVKRAGAEESRRIAELAEAIAASARPGAPVQQWRERLERIAACPNLDLLGAAEALADLPADRRTSLVARCVAWVREQATEADGGVRVPSEEQARAIDAEAPMVAQVVCWRLAEGTAAPEPGEELPWLLAQERTGVGLTGIIRELDALYEEVTGRRPVSTLRARIDRAEALQLRITMARAMAARPARPPEPAPPRPDTQPAPARTHVAQAERPTTAPEPVSDPGETAPATTARPAAHAHPAPETARADATDADTSPPARTEIATEQLAETVRRLARQVEVLRGELALVRQRADLALARLQGDEHGELPFEGAPSIEELSHRDAGRWLDDRRLLWVAIALAALALVVLALTWFGSGRRATPSAAAGPDPTPAATQAHVAAAPSSRPTRAPRQPVAPVVADAPDDEPAGEQQPAPPPAPQAGAPAAEPPPHAAPSVPPDDSAPGDDATAASDGAAVAPAPGLDEAVAERFGIGIRPTHRLTDMTKIFAYGRKLPLTVQELPGADALVDRCIIALAPREAYPKKLYPGYHPVLLSCAGQMRAVCETLGCEPQQACVTAASWVKPCR